ncbi:MAG TPA: hypothetical protein VIN75_18940 [Burkholderiaceae bacterium]
MANPDHGNDGRFTRTIEGAERDGEAARLKSRGLTYAQIARNLDYADASGAYRAVQRALAAAPVEGGDELRRLQSDLIDALTAQAFEVLESTHYAHTVHGDLIHGPDGQPMIDDMPVLHAIDRLIRLAERRSKLMGLDAPSRHEVITLDYLDAQIRDAAAELARAEAGEASDSA